MSISTYGVEIPTMEELNPLLGLVERCSGEIGFGSIHESTRQPLLRFRVASPEPAPAAPHVQGDVFSEARQRRAFEVVVSDFEASERLRREAAAQAASAFRDRLEAFLDRGATAPGTDVWGGVHRAELFLTETAPTQGAAEPDRTMLVVSDGRHNGVTPFRPVDPRVRVLVVNGSPSIGDLERLDPPSRVFEAVSAAVLHITTPDPGGTP